MSNSRNKETVITFKADDALLDALKSVPNRSQFIRGAILAALQHYCPLCGGTGVLTPNQKQHWEAFAQGHTLEECGDCHEVHLICSHGEESPLHKQRTRRGPAT